MYIFGGYSKTAIHNSFLKVEFNNSVNLTWEVINDNFVGPKSRMHHTINVIGTKLYLFGGERLGDKLNDL